MSTVVNPSEYPELLSGSTEAALTVLVDKFAARTENEWDRAILTELSRRLRHTVPASVLKPIADFVATNDSDTLARLRPDDTLLARASGSW